MRLDRRFALISAKSGGAFAIPTFDKRHAIFGTEEQGYMEIYESGTLTFSEAGVVDIFAVAGGGSGASGSTSAKVDAETYTAIGGQGGSAGAYNTWGSQKMKPGEYSVLIGAANGDTSIGNYKASGYSGAGGVQATATAIVSGTAKAVNGYPGSVGIYPFSGNSFAQVAGAGGSGGAVAGTLTAAGGSGGAGGGGHGGSITGTAKPPSITSGTAGTANTGSGGGGGAALRTGLPSIYAYTSEGGAGGSGIVIIRWGYDAA